MDVIMAALSHKCREIFMLSREYEHSYKNISKALKFLRYNILQ